MHSLPVNITVLRLTNPDVNLKIMHQLHNVAWISERNMLTKLLKMAYMLYDFLNELSHLVLVCMIWKQNIKSSGTVESINFPRFFKLEILKKWHWIRKLFYFGSEQKPASFAILHVNHVQTIIENMDIFKKVHEFCELRDFLYISIKGTWVR